VPSSGTYTLDLADGQAATGIDFGNHPTPSTSVNHQPVITSDPVLGQPRVSPCDTRSSPTTPTATH
jgi:hypothetical protein